MIKELYNQASTEVAKVSKSIIKVKEFLLIFLIIDFGFLLLHVYSLSLPLSESVKMLRVDMDGGYAELFQYLKFLIISLLLVFIYLNDKDWSYIVWSLFFCFLFIDDAFSLHETVGGELAKLFNFPSILGIRGQDFGELIFVGFIGSLFLLAFGYKMFSTRVKGRIVTIQYGLLVGVLVLFGVGIDVLHSLLKYIPGSGILTIIEDSGEMASTSLIIAFTIFKFRSRRQAEVYYQQQEVNTVIKS